MKIEGGSSHGYAMRFDGVIQLPESAVMQPDVNFTSGDSTRMHYI